MNNKKALEIINEEGFRIETMEELEIEMDGDTLYGKYFNLEIEIENGIIINIQKEPVVERETIFDIEEEDE